MLKALKRGDRRWLEFLARLEGPEGCDFVKKGPVDPKSITWKCAGRKNKSKAEAILRAMGGIDVEATLQYFEKHGGFCDCEILFNVPYT